MLKRLQVQHFRSLVDVVVDFGSLTLLVGPNATGKSNFVDALRFLRDAVVHGLDHAVSGRGGIDVIRQYSPTRPFIISFSLEVEYELPEVDEHLFTGSYQLRLSSAKGEYTVESEEATWIDYDLIIDDEGEERTYHEDTIHFSMQRDESGRIIVRGRHSEGWIEKPPLEVPGDTLALSASLFTVFGRNPIAEELSNMRFAHIYPNILRDPSRPDTDKRLKENCSNWASILKSMRQKRGGERAIQKITELMRQVLPGLKQVTVKGVGGYLVPQFLVEDKPGSKAHYFDPLQLSDGTLRLFAILLALYQFPPANFLALEEPEQTVHPGLLGLLVDAFREVSTETQLLITTHSPHLLDYFDPDEIVVTLMEHGETRILRMKESQIETVRQGLMSLSEIMALDGIRPDF